MNEKICLQIYDPPMCCSGGLCGPDVDPALLDIQETLLNVKAKWPDDVLVERYVLSQQPDKFMENPNVMRLIESHGTSALPATVINGEIQLYGQYPTMDELEGVVSQIQGGRGYEGK